MVLRASPRRYGKDQIDARDIGEFDFNDHMFLWSRMEFLMQREGTGLGTYLRMMKGRIPGSISVPSPDILFRRQREVVFPAAWGSTVEELDDLGDEVTDVQVDAMLADEDFSRFVRRHHQDLLWPSVQGFELVNPALALLLPASFYEIAHAWYDDPAFAWPLGRNYRQRERGSLEALLWGGTIFEFNRITLVRVIAMVAMILVFAIVAARARVVEQRGGHREVAAAAHVHALVGQEAPLLGQRE